MKTAAAVASKRKKYQRFQSGDADEPGSLDTRVDNGSTVGDDGDGGGGDDHGGAGANARSSHDSLDVEEPPRSLELEQPDGVPVTKPAGSNSAIELVGSIAGICTTAAFLPQVFTVHLTGDTEGLSLSMYCIFVSGVFLWMAYGVCKGAASLVLANLITFVLAGYILAAIIRNEFFTADEAMDAIDIAEAVVEDPTLANDPTIKKELVDALGSLVAVCAAGPVRTFTHPRVHTGMRDVLLQPGWHFFAALQMHGADDPAASDEYEADEGRPSAERGSGHEEPVAAGRRRAAAAAAGSGGDWAASGEAADDGSGSGSGSGVPAGRAASSVSSSSPSIDRGALRELLQPFRVQAALTALAAVDAVLYDADAATPSSSARRPPSSPGCDAAAASPPAAAAVGNASRSASALAAAADAESGGLCSGVRVARSVAPLAYGVEECLGMVERAERRRHLAYAYIVLVRPDQLWTSPLPPAKSWAKGAKGDAAAAVLQAQTGDAHFAIVPRGASSFLRALELLRNDCHADAATSNATTAAASDADGSGAAYLNRRSAASARLVAPECLLASAPRFSSACLFRTRLGLDRRHANLFYPNGAPVRSPRVGRVCSSHSAAGRNASRQLLAANIECL